MPIYHYEALDASGKKRKGMVEAHGEKEGKEKLRQQGILVTKFVHKRGSASQITLKPDQLLAFTIQLSQLINAQIPLYESLLTIEEQLRDEPYHPLILSLCNQVKGGTGLSEAMGGFPESFNSLYRAMVSAGESVGALHLVLEKLSALLTKQNKIKKQISTALIYPGILGCFSLLIIALLMGFVIPSIEEIFEGRTLNNFTWTILQISGFLRSWWWLYIPLIATGITLAVFKARSPQGKLWLERVGLKLPLIKRLMIHAALARFCRTMGTLQEGGLTLVDSLKIAKKVTHNHTLEALMDQAEERIMQGSSLSKELSLSPLIPLMMSRMLSVGEETGNSIVMMNKIADIYEEELEKSLDRLMALAQPVILIFMGTVIGVVLLAVLLPLTDISSLAV